MSVIRLFTDLDGRIGLRQFWLGSIALALCLLLVQWAAPRLVEMPMAMSIIAFTKAFALFPWAALAAKRATDRGGSAQFGIFLVCAIVLPAELQPHLGYAWRPSLDAISTIAWLIALVDLGLLPGARPDRQLAAQRAAAKPAS
ncbi:hypothetical protein [Bosea sp. (in: a-proteobacteria)]|jgi:uncharacterized membrane protein YhaH (DUF805 family)|uniref:DUF805 domain-containing protein n=1 Tax=Bosea sp. (in: a-proteobacteria) TaxID=1871050 RepID=UPI00086C651E|nr:hypothetical protein [Bosea sp. (in: a-proteobacteria)]MBN9439309.1 DUF805 domain-containing protein [Bosea sp. (in: a-proteobacteria)]MBN9446717.1 DUF805 domain-containing protein [Bosea sp. (in: a-proteobacteria)]ODT55246.1 MAG: hypothetical protein ABS59_04080 [Methylobacterium sp. SCN 67-24]